MMDGKFNATISYIVPGKKRQDIDGVLRIRFGEITFEKEDSYRLFATKEAYAVGYTNDAGEKIIAVADGDNLWMAQIDKQSFEEMREAIS